MKKYEVPVMKLHQLKSSTILAGSEPSKPFDEGNSGITTQKYEIDEDFDSKNFFDN